LSIAQEDLVQEAIRLYVDQDPDGQVDSVVPVRWCISRETAEMIQQLGIDDPQLVIIVENDDKEMDRYIVPVERLMQYVQFRRPGNNVLHATVMWRRGVKSVKKWLEGNYQPGYGRDGLLRVSQPRVAELSARIDTVEKQMWAEEENGDEELAAALQKEIGRLAEEVHTLRQSEPRQCTIKAELEGVRRLDFEAQLSVDVPVQMFAKQPPRLWTWLGNRYSIWDHAPRDQCDLRRRALFTLGTLWLVLLTRLIAVVVMETINLAVVGVLLLFGMRNLNFEALRHPFEEMPKTIYRWQKPSIWWFKHGKDRWGGKSYVLRHPVWFVINPPVILGCVVTGLIIYWSVGTLLPLILAVAVPFAIGFMIVLIGYLAKGPITRWSKRMREALEQQQEEQRKRAREALNRQLEQLACSSDNQPASISALPRRRRTVVLRYQQAKAKVCRPFAA
jgi:hypothetical protein